MNIFKECPVIENDSIILRLIESIDCSDLLKVYSDKNALPFFNSDGCNGDNFYYPTKERMEEALKFWKVAYENGWFVRLSIIDKCSSGIIGTVELCLRVSEDAFNNMGILRVDVRSDKEEEEILYNIFALITPYFNELLGCENVITKVPIYAVERIKAVIKAGFIKSDSFLIGNQGYAYDGYWIRKANPHL